jgi:POT family proton-dependent oligopeptide transporter
MLQFYFGQGIFGTVGLTPEKKDKDAVKPHVEAADKKIETDRLIVIGIFSFFTIFFWMAFEQAGGSMTIFAKDYTNRVLTDSSAALFFWINTALTIGPLAIITWVLFKLFSQTFKKFALSNIFIGTSFVIIWGIALWMVKTDYDAAALGGQAEVPASWFGILNSFFIIALAPLFSKMWESKLNPSGPVKFGIGLILLGLGFGVLAYGGIPIAKGAQTASISMVWLILAYLLHTLGELCVSPVGLSYVSKLAPARLVGLMFGIWFFASAIANYLAGWTASFIDKIAEIYSMSGFFLIYTAIPVAAGLIMIFMAGFIRKKMHGIH